LAGAYQTGVSATFPPLDILPRPAMQGEFVPPDYFKRLEISELPCGDAPLEVDLGCGDGSFLIGMAREFPERRFLGVERLLGRVRKVCRKITRESLPNANVLRLESRYAVEWLLPHNSVSRLHLLCPDPWPKFKHHRRRILQPEFLQAVHDVLVPGGEFLFMTDHEEYHEWAKERFDAFPGFERLPWEDGDFFYPKTDFQQLWESLGKSMYRTRCRKLVNPPAAQA
jgi:tRNA (guanine-N7-)-methyltransferase